ncbi:hypothetical protein [Acidianus manzaensis]|uniref:Nucleotidyltransferase n=1 Tax=Acidianus manzaensis TaxID=282676 RepID=A0A1W6K0P1_9CREN|nr:hypothetical protein [Acidianus manzaensis]ARM76057.1 hypothetical protein B6F84_08505 [Acidianus manzaensis]
MYNLLDLCSKAKALGYFGSYTREDYVEDLSDINVFAISSDKSLILELGSYGLSPLVISEESFKDLCLKGDPICYYILYDSKIVCGELPKVDFIFTDYTCERLEKSAKSYLKLSYDAYFRQDEVGSLVNSVRALRSLIQFKSCKDKKIIPISDKDVEKTCNELNLKYCDSLSDLLHLKKSKLPITLWSINKLYDIISSEIALDFPKPASE